MAEQKKEFFNRLNQTAQDIRKTEPNLTWAAALKLAGKLINQPTVTNVLA